MKPNSPLRLALAAASGLLSALAPGVAAAGPPDPYAYEMKVLQPWEHDDPVLRARYTKAWSLCQDKAETTSDNARCFDEEFPRQDQVLNATWRATLRRLSPDKRPALIAAERRWAAARDPFCLHDSDAYSQGTFAPVDYSSCRVEVTIRRIIWLETL